MAETVHKIQFEGEDFQGGTKMKRQHDGTHPPDSVDLTVIIVNYNVKEFLANCLQSVDRASKHLRTEIFVVDNASTDKSVDFLTPRFPHVTFIQNNVNVGFGKANNQVIPRARGRYTLLLNPDTLLQEDTLDTLARFMDRQPKAGACGCKILNPDGSFAAESRRSVPTLSSALYKAVGLTALFPRHSRFGRYYMGWLDEEKTASIPVLSGSFMFFRTHVLQEAGGFDERFFMYGEDIDLCCRVTRAGHSIWYVPDTSIIHYKGESSKRDDFTYNKVFNEAMFLFFDKHYTSRYSTLFTWGVYVAVKVRTLASFFFAKLQGLREAGIDLLLLNLSLFTALAIRVGFEPGRLITPENLPFLWLNLLLSLLYLLFAKSSGLLSSKKDSLPESMKAVLLSFTSLVVLTFFIRNLAFSRIIIAVAALIALLSVLSVRLFRINRLRRLGQTEGKVSPTRVLIVGAGPATGRRIDEMNARANWHMEITGILGRKHDGINPSVHGIPYLGSTIHIERAARDTRSNLVIFLMESVTHTELIDAVRRLKDLPVAFKLVPEQMNFMIGKAEVEYLDDLPLVKLDLSYFNIVQRVIKRTFDVVLSSFLLGLMLPLSPFLLRSGSQRQIGHVAAFDGRHHFELMLETAAENLFVYTRKQRWRDIWRILGLIWRGKLSFVGASPNPPEDGIKLKTGLTGYAMLNEQKIKKEEEREQFELYYLQNYSLWLDIDLLLKAIVRGKTLLSMSGTPTSVHKSVQRSQRVQVSSNKSAQKS